jgi:RNA polymerase sigma factor (TIGR02999 family)
MLYLGQMPDRDEGSRALFEAVNAIVSRHDPAGLIAGCGCPPDQYEREVARILAAIDCATDASELRSIIYQVFQHSFERDRCGPEERYEQIAQQIWDVWQQTADVAAFGLETPTMNEDLGTVSSQDDSETLSTQEVTRLLKKWGGGSEGALDEIFSMIHAELLRRARGLMWRERREHTLDPAGLLNELYMRMRMQRPADCPNRRVFYAVALRQMRQVLIEYARRRAAGKRPPPHLRVFTNAHNIPERRQDAPALADALHDLEKLDPLLCEILQLYYFVGLSQKKIAETIGIPVRKVDAELQTAKAWLSAYLKSNPHDA